MTTVTGTVTPIAGERALTRRLGWVCLAAGLLGVASGFALAVAPAAVSDDLYSYPLTATAFTWVQIWFAIQHLGLAAGIVGLRRASPPTRWRAGCRLALAGMLLLTATELLATGSADSTYPGKGTDLLDALYGISTIAIGVGLIVAGVGIVRSRIWSGWRRWLTLVLGAYVFVPMFPAMFGSFLAARLAISGWMLLFALLGWVLIRADE